MGAAPLLSTDIETAAGKVAVAGVAGSRWAHVASTTAPLESSPSTATDSNTASARALGQRVPEPKEQVSGL